MRLLPRSFALLCNLILTRDNGPNSSRGGRGHRVKRSSLPGSRSPYIRSLLDDFCVPLFKATAPKRPARPHISATIRSIHLLGEVFRARPAN